MTDNKKRQNTIIYVRGHNQEMQEILCLLYASDEKYKVLFTTNDMSDVYNAKNCDILLATNGSRISRDRMEYQNILNDLKKKDIKFVSVSNPNREIDEMLKHLWLADELQKEKERMIKERERKNAKSERS